MTILVLATDLDSHVLYANSGRTAAQTAYLVNSINAGLEDMRAFSPQSFRSTVDLTWTQGVALTTAVSGITLGPSATFANYTAGCSLNISGDATFNELATVGDGAIASTAIFAYTGTPGSVGMTIWGDCVKLATSVDRVIGGALLHERRPLEILGSRAEWLAWQRLNGIYPYDYGFGSLSVQPTVVRQPGVPRALWLETVLNGNAIEYRARCSPMPNADYRATLDVQTMPTVITADDVTISTVTVTGTLSPDATGTYSVVARGFNGADVFQPANPNYILFFTGAGWVLQAATGGLIQQTGCWSLNTSSLSPAGIYAAGGANTGTATVALSTGSGSTRPVPGHREYNILRALCLFHWSNSPWFKNEQARAGIMQGYQNAVEQLKGFRNNAAESPISVVQY